MNNRCIYSRDFIYKKYLLVIIWLFAVLFLWIPYIFPYFSFIDEQGLFASAVQIAKGKLLYKDVFESKGPALISIYLFFIKLFPSNYTLALHIVLLLLILFNSLLLYKILSKYGTGNFSLLAFLYPFLLACFYPGNMIGSREPFLTSLILFVFFLILYFPNNNFIILLSGFLSGTSILFKPFGIFFILSFAFLIYYYSKKLSKCYLFLFACSIIPLIFLSYLFKNNLWNDFLLWNFDYAVFISRTIPFGKKVYHGLAMLGRIFLFNPVYIIFGLPVIFNKSNFNENVALIILSFSALLWAVLHGLPFPHYYIPLIPFLVLLSIKGFYLFYKKLGPIQNDIKKYLYFFIIFSIFQSLLHWNGIDFHKKWKEFLKEKKWKADYEIKKDYEMIKYLRENTDKTDKIVIWGLNPKIYLFSEREPGTRFISSVEPVNGFVYYAPSQIKQFLPAEKLFLWDMEENNVKYFIDATNRSLLGMAYYTIDKYPYINNYLLQHFHIIKEIDGYKIWKRK